MIADLEAQLDRLIEEGELLYYAMARELGVVPADLLERLEEEEKLELPSFGDRYDAWYSTALRVVGRVVPDRLDDFVVQYRNDKRRHVDYLSYTISDYLVDLKPTRGEAVIVDSRAGLPKMQRQVAILRAARQCFASTLLHHAELLRGEMLDAELEAAGTLLKRGHPRAAGALAGLVLAHHLAAVCETHQLKVRKRGPSIAELTEALEAGRLLETAERRHLQRLAEIHALCEERGGDEPEADEIAELLTGVARAIKTVG